MAVRVIPSERNECLAATRGLLVQRRDQGERVCWYNSSMGFSKKIFIWHKSPAVSFDDSYSCTF